MLDLGCGIGSPARYLAATFGCKVTGVDLSPSFIDAATYLTRRCGLADRVHVPGRQCPRFALPRWAFDTVFLQHVAMNVEDRVGLYREMRRIMSSGGRFATYDLVLPNGDVVYPVPWARDASTSFLLSEEDTQLKAVFWGDDTHTALEWFKTVAGSPPSEPNLSVVIGPDFRSITRNLAQNIRENRLGVLSAVA